MSVADEPAAPAGRPTRYRGSMRIRSVVSASLLALVAIACDADPAQEPVTDDGSITVASFNFPESEIVAEIYAGALEGAGFDVQRIPDLGTRELVLPALERGLVEVVPDYAGSAVSFLGGVPSPIPARTHALLQNLLQERGIRALRSAPAQNRNELVVTLETANRFSLNSISDLTPHAPSLTLGGPPECVERPLCLPGLQAIYGLEFNSFIELDTGGPVTAEGIERGVVDVGLLFTTDGLLRSGDLVALEDDRSLQPAENLTPLVRDDVLATFGDVVAETLDGVSELMTTEDLRALNAEVAAGSSPQDVAQDWLEAHDLPSGQA
jgi:osmoprotectant transport system substrate-binding protein